jgi:GDPmannose 4,6-dehydratase
MHGVEELVELAFGMAGLDWRDHVVTDAAFTRPAEVDRLCANPAKAAADLRLGAEDRLRGAGRDDGRGRPGAAVGVGQARRALVGPDAW